jgi:hypothetical protein
MDPRRRLAQRAPCAIETRGAWLIYRWPLEPVLPGRFPVLEVAWHEKGLMYTRFVEHDPALAPQEEKTV